MEKVIELAERGWLPDPVVRMGIRRLLRERLRSEASRKEGTQAVVEVMRSSALAVATTDANRQHYELPPDFFDLVLGHRLKYSACLWEESVDRLDDAEDAMLRLTCERAGIQEGQEVLELGCGWGSLSLWIAERYPSARVTAVSNSVLQRHFIEACCQERGLRNVQVVTADMNEYSPEERFDRIVSVEMFEHMRNYELLLQRIAAWLRPQGRLFVHIFCHRKSPYFFETGQDNDWMARHFFTGGLMPHEDIFTCFDRDMSVDQHWRIDGRHYEKTLRSWLGRLDRNREAVRALFEQVYGTDAVRWVERWRLFFLASAELFGFRGGGEWLVGHYLLAPRGSRTAAEARKMTDNRRERHR